MQSGGLVSSMGPTSRHGACQKRGAYAERRLEDEKGFSTYEGSIFALGYMEGAERRIQKAECSKFYCLLKGKYTVIITDVTVLLWSGREAIWIGMKGPGIHHAFARH